MRPRQWIKNFAVFAAALFAGGLFDPQVFPKIVLAFVVFADFHLPLTYSMTF